MAKTAGSIWIEVNSFRFIDQFNREWYTNGILVKAAPAGAKPGSVWVDDSTNCIHYVNEAGTQIYRTPGVLLNPIPQSGSKAGSVWVSQNNILYHISKHTPPNNAIISNHIDTATLNTHNDTHTDTPHTDTPHSDTPHTDIPAVNNHIDEHADSPHFDHGDSSHGDNPGNTEPPFQDFSDHGDNLHPALVHQDLNLVSWHGDYWSAGGSYHDDYFYYFMGTPPLQHTDAANHQDVPHTDTPHNDTHGDSPHIDEAAENAHADHWDSTAHTDTPHLDNPHGDGHSDTHGDSHGDAPHQDEPILVGP